MKNRLLVFLLPLLLVFACKKDPILTDSSAKLEFSADSVLFDTVFTTIGSTTRQFKIYNRNKQALKISSISLANGTKSIFRLNINGTPGAVLKDVEINAKDSLFIFVEVTVNPTTGANPFIVKDSVVFETNGNKQDVDLIAWGQNAHYIKPNVFPKNGLPNYSVLGCDTTWTDNLPHVVYGYAVVDSGCKLTIKEGTKIYFHKNSGLWVYRKGNLLVQGTKDKPVVFQGDRLEADYKDVPNQWDRIWINEGDADNEITYAEIKNGFIGLQVEMLEGPLSNRTIVKNTTIKNMGGYGVLTRALDFKASNTVISHCGTYAVAITGGGNIDFKHCTVGNYWNFTPRSTPSLVITNYFQRGKAIIVNDLSNAYFGNCIIYGTNENEIATDFLADALSNYKFENSLIRIDPKTNTGTANFVNILKNVDPQFVDNRKDYKINTSSPAVNAGLKSVALQVPTDILGNSRVAGTPDMGAYEVKP